MDTPIALHALAGFGLGISLIAAIGAQNAFVLRQGLRREHVLVVVVICALSDAVLIALGVAGIGTIVERVPAAIVVVRWAGALFLFGYGLFAARRAFARRRLEVDARTGANSLWTVAATSLALTWLNPHVYLDTLLLLGSVASTHGDGRWYFGAGAVVASILWFTAVGFGARLLGRVFARPIAWRILDGIIAVIMIVLAVQLLVFAP